MRIPPLYRKPTWQRFLGGAAVGGCISWFIFLFMFGVMQERNGILLEEQSKQINILQNQIKIWQEDYQELNKKNEDMLTVQEINVRLVNYEKYNIQDRQSIFNVEEDVQEDLKSLLAKDLSTVNKNKDIIKKTIENKVMSINGKRFKLVVKEMYFYTTIQITVELRLAG
ncbi:sporulation membrane protein YtrI [Lederbergia panacisoli]|uniref:sporulation membrane protein YtrI n=1 Tax=Lederbergia panacisoli TaxID=1255251 RepID=UPI00214CC26E|nr:sporulation membrane protein YtrI [Lederbergia panacisoli]MCR2821894.1 sporulation protein [Lederbergia panacisoli]